MLAKYYSVRDTSRVDPLVRQFADLASTESDIRRLATYQADIEYAATRILKNFPALDTETMTRLASVLADRFLIDVSDFREKHANTDHPRPRRRMHRR